MPLPPPSALKRKILIKNKRLKPEVERQELELFRQGQFVIEDEVKEDATAVAIPDKKVPTVHLIHWTSLMDVLEIMFAQRNSITEKKTYEK